MSSLRGIKFENPAPVRPGPRSKKQHMIDVLRQHAPNRWAVLSEKSASTGYACVLKKKNPDLEYCSRINPDGKTRRVYVRIVRDVESVSS